MKRFLYAILFLFLIPFIGDAGRAQPETREKVIKTVEQIQKADYEGDRKALQQLYEQLSLYADDKDLGSRVRYWSGFALWRRAINGFNETVDPKELEQDLMQAIDEFHKAIAQDPGFVDAKIGTLSCMGYLMYLNQDNKERLNELYSQVSPLVQEVAAAASDNPRFLWVWGPSRWRTPVEKGGGQEKAIEMYKKGLESIKNHKSTKNDPLEPTWGEPELLMNLAWSYLSRTKPDLKSAEEYARAALALVPYWHYVRDILLPQILEAKAKAEAGVAEQ